MLSSRDEGIKKSHQLCNLGQYSDALACLREVETEHEDLNVLLEISKLLLLMGLRGQALHTLTTALDKFCGDGNDTLLVAYARLLHSLNTMMQTARASEPLKIAIEVYHDHLKSKAVKEYTQRMVGDAQSSSMNRMTLG